ncbi:MAG: hypothetical protein F7B61_01755 [Caldisphaeraceae archaeon]|nr:hypothetical protein [Caldisphaeraceae archaeon]
MKCRYCGSTNIAWDHGSGHIVCQDCGAILGNIFEEVSYNKEEIFRHKLNRVSNENGAFEESVEKIVAKVLRRGKVLKSINGKISIVSIVDKNLDDVENDEELIISRKVLDGYPILKTRTKRNRYALALYAVYRTRGYSKTKSIELVSKRLKTSKHTLENILDKYPTQSRSFLESVRKALKKA